MHVSRPMTKARLFLSPSSAALLRSAMAVIMAVVCLAPFATHFGRAHASNQADDPKPALIAILTEQQASWNRTDIPAFVAGYWNSPDLTFSGTSGITRGYAGVLERYRKSYPDKAAMGELQFSGLEVTQLGPGAALVLGHWHLKRSSGDIGGVFTLVFRRFSEGWRIIHDHTSVQSPTP